MKKIVFIVGSGFSAGFTNGLNPIIGNHPMPVLSELTNALLIHLTDVIKHESLNNIPFSHETIKSVISILSRNEKLPLDEKFNFEQLISIISIGTSFSFSEILQKIKPLHNIENKEEILRCLIYFIPSLFAKHLSIDGQLTKNRNLFYTVNNHEILYTFQKHIRNFTDNYDVSYISFNYDGLLEAFLDVGLGGSPMVEYPQVIRYLPEISHGLPMTMPEHIFDNKDMRNLSNYRLPLVLKPHGSMHFYQLNKEISNICNIPTLAALHPRFDTKLFNEKTMQRDINTVSFWKYANPVPFIIPPVINKESYLSLDYSKIIISKMIEELSEAEYIISVGFSIPMSDMHMNALFQLVADLFIKNATKKVGLIFKSSKEDKTFTNWTRVFGNDKVSIIDNNGLGISSIEEVNNMWDRIYNFIK